MDIVEYRKLQFDHRFDKSWYKFDGNNVQLSSMFWLFSR